MKTATEQKMWVPSNQRMKIAITSSQSRTIRVVRPDSKRKMTVPPSDGYDRISLGHYPAPVHGTSYHSRTVAPSFCSDVRETLGGSCATSLLCVLRSFSRR